MGAALSGTGHFVTLLIMAFALGMDAFSLGIGIGIRGIRLLHVVRLSIAIAVFHVVMPLTGMFMGHYVSELLGSVATVAGGALLVALGAHMVYNALKGDKGTSVDATTVGGVLFFALTVSIDSFSVGVSLGMFASDIVLTVLLFGLSGGGMSIAGLLLGRRVAGWVGEYGEALGGIILLVFGIEFLV